MTWIVTKGQKSISISAPLEKAFAVVSDYERLLKLYPGIEKVEKQGEGVFRCLLEEKSTAGLKFKGDYVVRYENNGKDEVRWSPVSGNLKSTGSWRLVPQGDGVLATITLETEADAPIPALMKAIAKPFAQSELNKGLEQSAENLKRAVESS